MANIAADSEIQIDLEGLSLFGTFHPPTAGDAFILFAHGSGSSRHSPRNRMVASELQRLGFGTVLFDLLTPEEEEVDLVRAELRFNIPLLAERLVKTTDWLVEQKFSSKLRLGYFGASTGAAAALIAAAQRPELAQAVVSRGGRPDLAASWLSQVKAPTLLIVGGNDRTVILLNRDACEQIVAKKKLEIIPNASHLFEERGALHQVAQLAGEWFQQHLR